MRITLARDWDYPPSPLGEDGHFVGRRDEVDRLANDILRKDSGAVLISGARGVGKTSLAYRALQVVREESKGGERQPIAVLLNASQLQNSMTKDIDRAVITGLIRRLYAAVHEHRESNQDPSALGDGLRDLYRKAVSSRAEITTQRARGSGNTTDTVDSTATTIQVNPPLKTLIVGGIGFLSGGLGLYFLNSQPWASLISVALLIVGTVAVTTTKTTSWKNTKTSNSSLEAKELYVKDNDIGNLESDLERVLSTLSLDFKVVFVIDELDKLIDSDGASAGPAEVLKVIRGFKNLFTLSPAVFLFITGDEVYGHVERSRETRNVDGTLFTYRFFLKRPEWADLEQFIREVAVVLDANEAEFEDFIDYLCYEARSDFTYLYDVLRDHVTAFDSQHRPIVEMDGLAASDRNKGRAQKALGLVYDQYRFTRPSGWQKNEELLAALYASLGSFVGKRAGAGVTEAPPSEPSAPAIIDLLALLERHGGLRYESDEAPEGDPSAVVKKYSSTGTVDPIPGSLGDKTTLEKRTIAAWNDLTNLGNAYTRVYSAVTTGKTPQGKWSDKNRFVTMSDVFGLDLRPRLAEVRPIITGLQKKPAQHQTREQLDQAMETLRELEGEALAIALQVAAQSVRPENLPLGDLESNPSALDKHPVVRSAVLESGAPTVMLLSEHNPTRVALLLQDAPQALLDKMAASLKTSNRTLKVIDVCSESVAGRLPKNASKRGVYSISLEQSAHFIQVLRGTRNWLAV